MPWGIRVCPTWVRVRWPWMPRLRTEGSAAYSTVPSHPGMSQSSSTALESILGTAAAPLFDVCGRVVGVNTAGPSRDSEDTNWASHINESIRALRGRIAFREDAAPCVSVAGDSDPEAVRATEEAAELASTAQSKAESAKQGSPYRRSNRPARPARKPKQPSAKPEKPSNEPNSPIRIWRCSPALPCWPWAWRSGNRARKLIRIAGQIAEPFSRRSKSGRRRPKAARAQPDPPQLVLTGFDPHGRPIKIALRRADLDQRQGGFTIGRHPLLVDQVLDDNRVSRRHARFSATNGAVCIEDLNSSNGTTLNGSPCPPFAPTAIHPGDMVGVGDVRLRVSN